MGGDDASARACAITNISHITGQRLVEALGEEVHPDDGGAKGGKKCNLGTYLLLTVHGIRLGNRSLSLINGVSVNHSLFRTITANDIPEKIMNVERKR